MGVVLGLVVVVLALPVRVVFAGVLVEALRDAGAFVRAGVFRGVAFADRTLLAVFEDPALLAFAGPLLRVPFVSVLFVRVFGAIGSLEVEVEEHVLEFIDVLADLEHVFFENFEVIFRLRVVRRGANELLGRIVQSVDLGTNAFLEVA